MIYFSLNFVLQYFYICLSTKFIIILYIYFFFIFYSLLQITPLCLRRQITKPTSKATHIKQKQYNNTAQKGKRTTKELLKQQIPLKRANSNSKQSKHTDAYARKYAKQTSTHTNTYTREPRKREHVETYDR